MNATDLLLLGVIAVSTLLGLLRGFVGVLASLLAWLLAGWALRAAASSRVCWCC